MLTYISVTLRARLALIDERGASGVEYGLLLAGVAAVIVLAVYGLGGTVLGLFRDADDAVSDNLGK